MLRMFNITLIVFVFIKICQCSFEFTAHNFVNYKVRGSDYGIPYMAVHGKLRQFLPDKLGITSEDSKLLNNPERFNDEFLKLLKSGRNVYLLKFNDLLTKKFYWIFFKNILKTSNNTLLLILPNKKDILFGFNTHCDEAHATEFSNPSLQKCEPSENPKIYEDTLNKFERFLYKSRPKCSISLTEMDDNIAEILKHTIQSGGGLLSDDVRVSTPRFHAYAINSFLTINLFGESVKVPPSDSPKATGDLKKVLVTCSLDTFGVLQTYSSGAQFNSSLVFMLELTRVLKNLDNPHFELVFLMHSASVVDYAGLRYFLRNKKDFVFAVHFGDLSGDNLYLHTLKSHEEALDPYLKLFASKMRVAETYTHPDPVERTDKAQPKTMDFSHVPEEEFEVFFPNDVEFKNLPSFTITSSPERLPLYKSSYSLTHRFNSGLLTQRLVDGVRAFSELLNITPPEINMEEVRANVNRWQSRLSEPRNSLTSNLLLLESVKEVVSQLENDLKKLQVQNFRTVFSTYKFFTTAPNKCTVYTTKHPAFDILVFAIVTLYVLAIWTFSRGSLTLALEDIYGLFQKILNEGNLKFKRK